MKTYLADIFPKIQRFSQKLDDLSLLTNQHWVSIDDILTNKTVYIFRSNNTLLVSTNGKVEKASWEYIGNKSLLIDKSDESLLFKHGFIDDNILALKMDSNERYAVFVNENKYGGELNSIDAVIHFLSKRYLNTSTKEDIENIIKDQEPETSKEENVMIKFETNKGVVELEPYKQLKGTKAYLNGKPAPDGRYSYSFWEYFIVKDGIII
jgi:hypothetical protein